MNKYVKDTFDTIKSKEASYRQSAENALWDYRRTMEKAKSDAGAYKDEAAFIDGKKAAARREAQTAIQLAENAFTVSVDIAVKSLRDDLHQHLTTRPSAAFIDALRLYYDFNICPSHAEISALMEQNGGCTLGYRALNRTLEKTGAEWRVDAPDSTIYQAVKEGLISANTAKRATPPKVTKHEMETFEVEEVQTILSALETEPLKWQACVQLLIATGARRGEIMGLRWENVDWSTNRLYLCENRVYTPESGAISTTLKTEENRYVTISLSVMDLLKRWRIEQATVFLRLGVTPSGYVLTAENGGPMHPDSPTDWLAKFSKRHGLPPIHPHKFRHTQASLLIAEGVDILTISKRLGHAKVSTTLDIYSHQLAKSDELASEALDGLIFKKKA